VITGVCTKFIPERKCSMKAIRHKISVWRYSREMKVMAATLLVGLIFIFSGSAAAGPQGGPDLGNVIVVNKIVPQVVVKPVFNPFAPVVRPFPFAPIARPFLFVNPFIRQVPVNPFFDVNPLGAGLGIGAVD
jgi:hypothetical protein